MRDLNKKLRRSSDRIRAAPRGQRFSTARATARSVAKRSRRSIRQQVFVTTIGAVDRTVGRDRADRAFFASPILRPTWQHVQLRLATLHRSDPDAASSFVHSCLESTTDPITVAFLARHPVAQSPARSWLDHASTDRSSHLAARLRSHRLLGAAVAGAGRVLLPPADAEGLAEWISDLYHSPDSSFFQFADSMGFRTCGLRPAGDTRSSPQRPSAYEGGGRRLVIVEDGRALDAVATLFSGADEGTLFATSDTFGRIDLGDATLTPLSIPVTVEHLRTRITRFSQPYIDVHEATARVAEELANALVEAPDVGQHVDAAFLAADLADSLFFKALATRAISALTDDDFDHIVVAIDGHRASSSFIRQLGSVEGFWSDPRVEIVSVSDSNQHRSTFWRLLEGIEHPVKAMPRRAVPNSLIGQKLGEACDRDAAALPLLGADDRSRVVVATTQSPAYDASTAVYIRGLVDDHDVTLLSIGSPSSTLSQATEDLLDDERLALTIVRGGSGAFPATADLVSDVLRHRLQTMTCDADDEVRRVALAAATNNLPSIARSTAVPSLVRMKVLHRWFEISANAGRLPDVVVVTPHRSPGVGVLEVICRTFGVPTIAVEPHAHDANYSRYLKIAADFYGVMSEYFRSNAAVGLGIGHDRIWAIGSPRQIAPANYDRLGTQAAERQRLEREHPGFDPDLRYVVFFAQPSEWAHVAAVWRNVLLGASSAGVGVLLKSHPEEVPGRVRQYVDLARALDVEPHVLVLDGDAEQAIAAADIVLTAYSAAAIDAAVRGVPVIAVTDGDVDYPVDIADIVRAPFVRSSDELGSLLRAFLADPAPFLDRARELIEKEPQFVSGPELGLRALVDHVIDLGPSGLRAVDDVPSSLFIDGPHPVYRV